MKSFPRDFPGLSELGGGGGGEGGREGAIMSEIILARKVVMQPFSTHVSALSLIFFKYFVFSYHHLQYLKMEMRGGGGGKPFESSPGDTPVT